MTPLPIPDDGWKLREVRERKLFRRIRPKGRGAIAVTVETFFPTGEETAAWAAMAHTPETRARIRRWCRAEVVAITTTLIGIALLLAAPFASIAVAVWSVVTDADLTYLYWWIWGVVSLFAVTGGIAWVVATRRRQRACFADGQSSVGTVDQAIAHPGSGDDRTWYDLQISAALPDGTVLHRRLHLEGEQLGRRVGAAVRFRHNSLDPDALDDVHLTGWPDKRQ